MNRSALTLAAALCLLAGLAHGAEPPAALTDRADRCAPAPHDAFRPESDLRTVLEGLGYQPRRIGTERGCYVVRAVDRRGKPFDIRFEGATLRMVSRYVARTDLDVVAER